MNRLDLYFFIQSLQHDIRLMNKRKLILLLPEDFILWSKFYNDPNGSYYPDWLNSKLIEAEKAWNEQT